MKKVIFCNAESRKMLPMIIEENKGNHLVLVQLDIWLKDFPIAEGVSLREYKDYLTVKDYLEIEKDALTFSRNWYKLHGEDLTKYQGYSLGEALEVSVRTFFIWVLKNILFVKRVRENEPRAEFIIFDDKSTLSKIFLNFLSENNVKFKRIDVQAKHYKPESFETFKVPMPPVKILNAIKSNLQDAIWVVVNKLLSILSYRHAKSIKPKLNIYFDYYKGYYTLVERLFSKFNYKVFLPQPAIRDFKHISFLKHVFKNKVRFYPLKHCKDYLSDAFLKKARQFPDDCWKKFINFPEIHKEFTWKGVNFWNAVSEELRDRYIAFFSELILEISYAEHIIQKYQLDTFLMPWDDALFHRSFTSVAKKMGLATMRYQHGISVKNTYLPMPRSDKVVVWGEGGRDFYLKIGVLPENIIIAGFSIRDLLVQEYSSTNRLKFCRKFKLDPSKKIVFYADTPYSGSNSALSSHYDTSQVLLKFVNAANKLPDIQFLVKFHQGDFAEEEKIELIKKHSKVSNICIFRWYFDIYMLGANSDTVITEYSTAGLEAMILDKPVIIFELRHKDMGYLSPYEDGKGVVVVNREEDIVPTIKRIFTDYELLKKLDNDRKEFLEYEGAK